MMYDFSVKIAGINFSFSTKYRFLYKICSSYLTESTPDEIKLSAKEEEITEQRNELGPDVEDCICESVCIHRKVAEVLAEKGFAAFHGAAILFEGKSYIFTAPSGTGKSTHIRLWHRLLGRKIDIINGDKPILGVDKGVLTAFSSPWAGKEKWQKNNSAPIGAICILERSPVCTVRRAGKTDLIPNLLRQIYLPDTASATDKTLSLFDRICSEVPIFVLGCDMSEEAVKTSFEALTGKNYSEYKIDPK